MLGGMLFCGRNSAEMLCGGINNFNLYCTFECVRKNIRDFYKGGWGK